LKDARFPKFVVALNAMVPLALLAWDGYRLQLGANPTEFALHTTGMLALIFLTLSLAVTPLRKVTGYNFLSHFRRLLGLCAFFYGCLHLFIYVVWDQSFELVRVLSEILSHTFLQLGLIALLMMAPLAATSTNAMIKKMGAKRWKALHMLAYPAAILGVIHYWMEVKADTRLPKGFAIALAILLGYRLVKKGQSMLRPPAGGSQGGGRGFPVVTNSGQ